MNTILFDLLCVACFFTSLHGVPILTGVTSNVELLIPKNCSDLLPLYNHPETLNEGAAVQIQFAKECKILSLSSKQV